MTKELRVTMKAYEIPLEKCISIPKYVRFKGFELYRGWDWQYGGEGKVIAETNSEYKIKLSWMRVEWAKKEHCEEINFIN